MNQAVKEMFCNLEFHTVIAKIIPCGSPIVMGTYLSSKQAEKAVKRANKEGEVTDVRIIFNEGFDDHKLWF